MATVGSLVVKLIANTGKFTAGMKGARNTTRKFRGDSKKAGAAAKGMGSSMAAASVGVKALAGSLAYLLGPLAAIGAVTKIGRVTEDLSQSMASSLAIMGNVSEKTRAQLLKTAHDVAFETKFAAKEAAGAYYYLTSAGLDVATSLKVMPRVAQFAQAGMFDLSRATDIATDSLSAMGLASKDADTYLANMNRMTNVTVGAAKKANASVEQFGEALMNKGALAAQLVGMELEEVTAIMMVMADKGFAKGADAGQAVWMALRDLKTKAVENKEAFADLGIQVDAGGGKMAGMADIMEDMTRVMGNLSPLLQQEMLIKLGLPSKSLAPILTLLGTSGQLREYTTYLQNLGDVVKEVADKQLPPLTEGWNKFTAAMTEMVSGIATGPLEGLGDVLEDIAEKLRSGAAGFYKWQIAATKLILWNEKMKVSWYGAALAGEATVIHIEELERTLRDLEKRLKGITTPTKPPGEDTKVGGESAIADMPTGAVTKVDAKQEKRGKELAGLLAQRKEALATHGMDAREQERYRLEQKFADVLGVTIDKVTDARAEIQKWRDVGVDTSSAAFRTLEELERVQGQLELLDLKAAWEGKIDEDKAEGKMDVRGPTEFPSIAAMEKGSAAAYSAIIQAQSPELKAQEKANEHLRNIEINTDPIRAAEATEILRIA